MSKTPKLRFKEFSGDWEEKKLGYLANVIDGDRGVNYPKETEFYDEEYCLFLNAKNVTKNGFYFDEKKFITREKDNLLKKGKLDKQDIVLTTRGTVGNIAYFSENIKYKNMRINSGMVLLRSKDIFAEYLYSYLKSTYFENQVNKVCFGSAQPQLTIKGINNFKILYPSINEQEKIASFFSLIDNKISLQSEKVEALKDYKKGMIQKIFNRELRFKDDEGRDYSEWEVKKLSEVLLERKEKNTGNLRVCSVAVRKGVIDQIEHLGRSFAAKDTSNYNLVKYGDIVYTKSPTGDFPYGIIKQSFLNEDVVVSPLYGVFEPMNFNLGYILHSYFYYKENTNNYLYSIIQKGAKNTINITNTTFLSKSLLLPMNENEQRKIASLLIEFDRKIEKEQEKLDSLNEYKKGLLQQMFV